jgi:hypothetical protein
MQRRSSDRGDEATGARESGEFGTGGESRGETKIRSLMKGHGGEEKRYEEAREYQAENEKRKKRFFFFFFLFCPMCFSLFPEFSIGQMDGSWGNSQNNRW